MRRAAAGVAIGALALGLCAAPIGAAPFTFIVYGDSRAGEKCAGNAVHMNLVRRMAAVEPAFVVNTGDMITGFAPTTNFVTRGTCTASDTTGSLKEIIAPLQERRPPAGLPMAYFPVIGNHDDGWGSKWYPDSNRDGICDVFDLRSLVPNHTRKPYFRSKRRASLTDAAFHDLLCSKTEQRIYPHFAYYSFDHGGVHFVVLRVNMNSFDLETCRKCRDQADYDDYYNVHQLHWLEADLEAARKDPATRAIFVFLHAPVFGSGDRHGNTPSWKRLAGLFTQHRVSAVFSGHAHVYERSVPIVVDGAAPEGVRDDGRGTFYVTTGGGGATLHGFRAQPWYAEVRRSTFHYVEVQVDGNRMKLRAVDAAGKVIDEASR